MIFPCKSACIYCMGFVIPLPAYLDLYIFPSIRSMKFEVLNHHSIPLKCIFLRVGKPFVHFGYVKL